MLCLFTVLFGRMFHWPPKSIKRLTLGEAYQYLREAERTMPASGSRGGVELVDAESLVGSPLFPNDPEE